MRKLNLRPICTICLHIFYEAMSNVLASGAVYKLYYPNYQIFSGQSSSSKSGTTRFSFSTKSLDYCIGTFQVKNRDTISTVLNSSVSGATAGEYGNASYTAGALINSGSTRCFNQSKYFARNGSGVKTGTWYCCYIGITTSPSPGVLPGNPELF